MESHLSPVGLIERDPTFWKSQGKVRFEAISSSNKQMSDAVEITIPVQAPTIVRRESVAGSFGGPQFDSHRAMPEAWKRGRGHLNTTISTSPWLPEIISAGAHPSPVLEKFRNFSETTTDDAGMRK